MPSHLAPTVATYFADGLLPYSVWAKPRVNSRKAVEVLTLRCDVSLAEIEASLPAPQLCKSRKRRRVNR